jgi:hypothetical protein
MTITFNEPVSGFSLANLQLTANGGANLLTSAQTLTTTDNTTWTLGNLAGLTAKAGTYTLTLLPNGIQDANSNALASGASSSFSVTPWQNTTNPLDVNNDGIVSPLDALAVINDINLNGGGFLPATFSGDLYLDVNGDQSVTPLDALAVINYLNAQASAAAVPAGAAGSTATVGAVGSNAVTSAESGAAPAVATAIDGSLAMGVSLSTASASGSARPTTSAAGVAASAALTGAMVGTTSGSAAANVVLNHAAIDSPMAAGNRRRSCQAGQADAVDAALAATPHEWWT